MSATPMPDVTAIRDPRVVAALVHPLRVRILELARDPRSATELAAELGEPRQRVNYHVRELHRCRLLRAAGRRMKRNLVEKRYVAAARSWVLSPEVLGGVAADPHHVADAASADHLLALGGKLVEEVGRARAEAEAAEKRLPTLSLHAEIRFESARQRREFKDALREAVTDVIARHTSPARTPEGRPGRGRPYRLAVGCWPVPPSGEKKEEAP